MNSNVSLPVTLPLTRHSTSSAIPTCCACWASSVIKAPPCPKTETLTYKYKDLTGWKIGTQIEGMEIIVKSSISREARFVLTFDGI